MSVEHHDLVHEFPELNDRIHELKMNNAHFRRLFANGFFTTGSRWTQVLARGWLVHEGRRRVGLSDSGASGTCLSLPVRLLHHQ